MDLDEKENDLEISKDFLEDLECPICLEIPNEIPIYQCNKGHIHCKNCHPKLKSCVICRSKNYKIRALMIEKLIKKIGSC